MPNPYASDPADSPDAPRAFDADDPLGPARPVTMPAPTRATSPSRTAGGRRRRAHPARWGRLVAAGGASLAVVALTLQMAGGVSGTTNQASTAKASGSSGTTTRSDDDGDSDDEYSAATSGTGASTSSSSSSNSSSSSSSSSRSVSTSRGS